MKKLFCLLSVLMLCAWSAGDTLYTCDFSQDAGWAAIFGHEGVFTIQNGTCNAHGKGENSISYFYHTQPMTDFTFSANLDFNDAANDSDRAGLCLRLDAGGVFTGYYLFLQPDHRYSLTKIIYGSPSIIVPIADGFNSWISPTHNHVEASVQGSRIRGSVNGVLILDTTDVGLTAGNIGLCVQNKASVIFDDVAVVSNISGNEYPLAFSDNFDDGNADDWMKAKVMDNTAAFLPTAGALLATGGGSPVYYTFLNSGRYRNFTLTAAADIQDAAVNNDSYSFGLVFRGNYYGKGYYFGITENQYYSLSKILDNALVDIVRSSAPNTNITKDQNQLKVRAVNDSIYLYANGVPLFSGRDAAFASGDIGFFVTSDISVSFDDVELQPIPSTVVIWSGASGSSNSFSVFPNPFSKGLNVRLAAAGHVSDELEVFTLDGRLVTRLALNTGTRALFWDGRDNRGRPVNPGTYLVSVRSHGQLFSRQVILDR